ncbi:hypothetical protein SAOR_13390 [Salinisphaera orenii MK-B5]|uniref:Uncharacterized protein n=2 Tax=Salinisphaera orenii TaxID=856731 RepID=A0A423PHF4_9GAMM|nr:hypothetical protein SAOR_13390 [Salinisphaera orenii MK-B5]ROO37803.1 hypothetical protein SAHL_00835 [Salinisphaera halophila YIM 95161]
MSRWPLEYYPEEIRSPYAWSAVWRQGAAAAMASVS